MDSTHLIYTAVTGFGALLGFAVTAAYAWYMHTDLVIKSFMKFSLYRAGCTTKYVKIGDILYCYAERGQQSKDKLTMVFVHGFSASKDMWVQTINKFPKDVHCILIDLPGHGDTTIPGPEFDVSLDGAIHQLHEFIESIHLNTQPFHLVGISMGGAISQNYAVNYADEVAMLTLICPAMRTPEETEFQREITHGKCRLIVDDVDGLREVFNHIVYHKLELSTTTLKGLLKMRLPRNPHLTRVFEAIRKIDSGAEGREYEEKAALIQAPTQVIWGDHDELIHVSGAELLRSRLQHCARVDILERCGHSCNIDRPGLLAKCLLQFKDEFSHKKQH